MQSQMRLLCADAEYILNIQSSDPSVRITLGKTDLRSNRQNKDDHFDILLFCLPKQRDLGIGKQFVSTLTLSPKPEFQI